MESTCSISRRELRAAWAAWSTALSLTPARRCTEIAAFTSATTSGNDTRTKPASSSFRKDLG
jgi:hypothetical protein